MFPINKKFVHKLVALGLAITVVGNALVAAPTWAQADTDASGQHLFLPAVQSDNQGTTDEIVAAASCVPGPAGTYFADVNGDKAADAIVVNTTGITVRYADPLTSTFLPNTVFVSKPFSRTYGKPGNFFADVHGDGKADAMLLDGNLQLRVRSAPPTAPFDEGWGFLSLGEKETFVADVTGDNKADFIRVNQDRIIVNVSTGNGMYINESWTLEPYFGNKGTYFADVNGDKAADAIVVNTTGIMVRYADPNTGTPLGRRFLPKTRWTLEPYFGNKGTYFADVTGDGRADAIAVNTTGITVRPSDGRQFLQGKLWTDPFYGNIGTYFADIDADGKADAIAVNTTGITVRRSNGQNFLTLELPAWSTEPYYGNIGQICN